MSHYPVTPRRKAYLVALAAVDEELNYVRSAHANVSDDRYCDALATLALNLHAAACAADELRAELLSIPARHVLDCTPRHA